MSNSENLKRRIRRENQCDESFNPRKYTDLNQIPESIAQFPDGKEFVVLNQETKDGKILLIFMSEFGKDLLTSSQIWMCDGTFGRCPKPFQQLYVVHSRYCDKVLPSMYAYLPNKNLETYRIMFGYLKEAVSGNIPQKIFLDLETAAIKAINSEFGSVCSVSVCNFHFKQALLRQVGFKGCKKLLNDDPTFKTAFDMLKALAYVPVLHVIQVHESVVVRHSGENTSLIKVNQENCSSILRTLTLERKPKASENPRCFL